MAQTTKPTAALPPGKTPSPCGEQELRAKAKAALIRFVEALADRQALIDHEAALGKGSRHEQTRSRKPRRDLRPVLD